MNTELKIRKAFLLDVLFSTLTLALGSALICWGFADLVGTAALFFHLVIIIASAVYIFALVNMLLTEGKNLKAWRHARDERCTKCLLAIYPSIKALNPNDNRSNNKYVAFLNRIEDIRNSGFPLKKVNTFLDENSENHYEVEEDFSDRHSRYEDGIEPPHHFLNLIYRDDSQSGIEKTTEVASITLYIRF